MKISILMVGKNVENYIQDSIFEFQKENIIDWELIFIDDYSEDNTYEIVKNLSYNDGRILFKKNNYPGKINGINLAFSMCTGSLIKLIDADDILKTDWFSFINQMKNFDSHCHSMLVVDENLNKITKYYPNNNYINSSFETVATNIISLPKGTWSFKRIIADQIFPLPIELPFEDAWISILIKKHSKNILVLNEPLYLYRQHDNQTYGGILNFNKAKNDFRSKRILKLIDILKFSPRILSDSNLKMDSFNEIEMFYNFLLDLESNNLKKLLFLKISFNKKLRLFSYKYLTGFSKYILLLKWKLDGIKNWF